MTANVLNFVPRKSAAELERELHAAQGEFVAKWPDINIDDMRKVVQAYDRWRAVFLRSTHG